MGPLRPAMQGLRVIPWYGRRAQAPRDLAGAPVVINAASGGREPAREDALFKDRSCCSSRCALPLTCVHSCSQVTVLPSRAAVPQ